MKNFQAITAILGVVYLLAPGALAWPHGSEATCPPGPEPVCTNPPEWDEKLPHPTDCHYWIHCDAGGLPVCKICPAGLHFNNETKNCDYPENAKCQPGAAETTTAEPTTAPPTSAVPTTTTAATNPPTTEDPVCPGDHPNCPSCNCLLKRASHYECSFYYQCDGSKYILQKCPDGLHFNAALSTCDYPCNAGCSSIRTPKLPLLSTNP